MSPKVTIIISFYNKIDFLKLLFAGIKRQTFKDFEIIIADDGSNKKIVQQLEKFLTDLPFPVLHLWQEDSGFRKNKILNKAIVHSSSDYLIFIDGDCVPHKEFINEHFQNKKENTCVTGRRVNLSDRISKKLNEKIIEDGYLENHLYEVFFDGIFRKASNAEKGFYFKSSLLRNIFNKKKRGLLGCNFSIYKKDFLSINGFDERYDEPATGEDSDVEFRLTLNNIEIKSLNNIAIQYHLFHIEQERSIKNLSLFEEVKKQKMFFTPFGIQKNN